MKSRLLLIIHFSHFKFHFKKLLFIAFLLVLFNIFNQSVWCQQTFDSPDNSSKKEIKKGWNFGGVPIIGYDSDLGFQFGALANIYYYGDGSTYPKYFHSFYFKISRFTKGSGVNQFFFDSPHLIPKVRVFAGINYLTEKALDFYGFNGYEAIYNPSWEDKNQDSSIYKTTMFYRHERSFLRIGIDLQGKLFFRNLKWLAGFTFLDIHIRPVNVRKINEHKKDNDKLPNIPGLYDEYVSWNIIKSQEKNGGMNNYIKLGISYDTRDNEPNPMNGIWSEIIFAIAPKFIGDGNYGFTKLSLIHRQYFAVVKRKLSFVYRLGYQGTIYGKVPFYFQPYLINSFSQTATVDGLGGSNTLRGILRDRVVGDGFTYFNSEFRWKIVNFSFIRQNWYFAMTAFSDVGMVVQPISVNQNDIPSNINQNEYFNGNDHPHFSCGGGLKIAMNQNFIVSVDYGRAFDKRDGRYGLYINLGCIF